MDRRSAIFVYLGQLGLRAGLQPGIGAAVAVPACLEQAGDLVERKSEPLRERVQDADGRGRHLNVDLHVVPDRGEGEGESRAAPSLAVGQVTGRRLGGRVPSRHRRRVGATHC